MIYLDTDTGYRIHDMIYIGQKFGYILCFLFIKFLNHFGDGILGSCLGLGDLGFCGEDLQRYSAPSRPTGGGAVWGGHCSTSEGMVMKKTSLR